MIELRFDSKDMRRVLGPLADMGKEVDKAVRASVRRAADGMRAELGRQITSRSTLRGGQVRRDIGKTLLTGGGGDITGTVNVHGKPLGMDSFHLMPNRTTARKGMRSSLWPLAGYKTGPGEPLRHLPARGSRSAAFVVRRGGRLTMLRRLPGGKLERVYGYSVQYFAAFDATVRAVEQHSRSIFEKRLQHEVNYRLSRLK